jgi:hypothetical protein
MVAEVLPIKTISRKITAPDIKAIADLVAKRITETGACLILGIEPRRWFTFKQRGKNQSRFDSLLTRTKEGQLAGHMANIEQFQVKDWRASHALLQLKAPERFGQQQGQGQQTLVAIISDQAMKAIADRIYGQPKPSQVIDVQEVKQVQDSAKLTQ